MKIIATLIAGLLAACGVVRAQATQPSGPFDGSRWNVSTGNLSVTYIQASPVGAFPRPGVLEPPPTVEAMKKMKADGLVAYEDYVAWGAIEREPGKWGWTQHDVVADAVRAAGLKYVVYNWVHFPPAWQREQKDQRTLMRCLEHGKETNSLSIFDPKTIEHYDRFYKNLAGHFGDKIDGVYACILGPYGEGNYPLYVPDWINIGHCHEGYWCADPHAIKAFQRAMRTKYADVTALNRAWGSSHASFDDVRPPKEATVETLRIHPDLFVTTADRRRWIDFIAWYHQSMIDFTEKSIQTTLKYFPAEKVRTKPGGNAGGVNPIAWGTYCPGYAKMAAKYPGVVLQPADWHGAYFGDKWVATAYHFYGVPLGTEPAGGLDHRGFVKRLFSDASCGTQQLFTYDFDKHSADIRRYAHLVTGEPGETEIAVLCPTTLYRLGGNLKPTIDGANTLRDLADFDVLDELLILDGALKPERYKLLVAFQADVIDRPVLDAIDGYIAAGGTVLINGKTIPRDLDGAAWDAAAIYAAGRLMNQLPKVAAGMKGFDGAADGVWTTRRGGLTFTLDVKTSDEIREKIEPIGLSKDGEGFSYATSERRFTPWGFNYDRDSRLRLIEDYWDDEWPTIEQDFAEMKSLGANVVRVHLQFGKFMDAPDQPNAARLERLSQLVRLAERTGLYLDLTGLACYRRQDVPAWYDALDEQHRWAAQATFWEAIAKRCAGRAGVFCYDLINEPVVPAQKLADGQWVHPVALAGFHYVQHVALDPAGRDRYEIARQWTKQMVAAIRRHDRDRLITVGLLPGGDGGGFNPATVAPELDFVSVHLYPERGKIDESLVDLKRYDVAGKPLVIEELFPIRCDAQDLAGFIERSRGIADGWIGFYWGKTPAELKQSRETGDKVTLAWLELFERANPNR